MPRRYQLIIFDWDGTLMDSAPKIVRCFERAFEDARVPSPGADAIRRVIGLGLNEAVDALVPQAGAAARVAVVERYREHFLHLDTTASELFPGVRAGLERLAETGHLLAVATGKSRRGLERVFEATGLRALFVASRCADEAPSKPHPRMVEDLLEATGMEPAQALMVGDTTYDLLMARSAGLDGVGVSYGVHARDELIAHGALACLDSFPEVPAWIAQASAAPASAKAARS